MTALRVPVLVFSTLIALVALGTWRVELHERDIVERENLRALRAVVDEVRTRTDEEIHALERMARRWEVRGGTPRDEWTADARQFVEQMDHLKAIEWVDADNVVRWIVPLEGNEAAVGLDLDFEENRRVAAAKARATRRPVSSPPIELVQGRVGFLVFVPIFEADRFTGFILGVHGLGEMLDRLVANISLDSVIAVEYEGEPLWGRGVEGGTAAVAGATDDIDIAGLRLRARVAPAKGGSRWLQPGPPRAFAMVGVALATVIALAVRLRQRMVAHHERASIDAIRLQAEVNARSISEDRLRERDEELAATYGAHPDVLFRLDDDWTILDLRTREGGDFFGATADSIDHDLRVFLPDFLVESLRRAKEETRQAGRHDPVVFSMGDAASGRHFEARLVALSGEQILLLVRDIEDRTRAEASRERFEEVLQETTDLVGMADANARTLFFNRAGRRMLGYGEDEDLSGQLIPDYHPPSETDRFREEVIPTARREGVWSGESDFLSRSGEIIPTLQVLIAHTGSSGEVEFYSTIARDMREIRAAERERRAIELKFHESQRRESLGVLAGGIAHDFNNLLVSMLGHADLALEDAPVGGTVEDGLKHIRNAALRAADLCNQMLAYSGRGAFDIRTFDLSEIVNDMQSLLRSAIQPGIDFKLELAAQPVAVGGDVNQIRQIVMNLITNAAESLTGPLKKISLRTSVEELDDAALLELGGGPNLRPGRYSLLEVRDSGCGMDEETQSRIFDPFYTTKFTGRGLGLAAVTGIVKRHDGLLNVVSRVGMGSTFTLLLPNGGNLAVPSEHAEGRAGRRTADVSILVVDDEDSVRTVVQKMVVNAGYESIGVESGEAALDALEKVKDGSMAVILDVTMPGMDGRQTAREIRSRFPRTAILLSSGFSGREARGDESSDDVDGFLQKPYTQQALVAALDEALSARRAESA